MAELGQVAVEAIPAADVQLLAPPGFEAFFRTSFRDLVRTAMITGATLAEAEDAAARTLEDIFKAWTRREYSLAWARRAVVHNFIKEKTRGTSRLTRRLIERGHVSLREGAEDGQLTELEDDEWIANVLSILPPAQRKVMECIARGLDRREIAETLGMSNDAVRRNLCDARARLAAELHPDGQHKHPPSQTKPRGLRGEDR